MIDRDSLNACLFFVNKFFLIRSKRVRNLLEEMKEVGKEMHNFTYDYNMNVMLVECSGFFVLFKSY